MPKKKTAKKKTADESARAGASKKRSSSKQPSGSARVEMKVDRALKQAWQRAKAALQDAAAQGAKAFDVKYETLAEILDHDPPLYLAGGYATDRAYLAAEIGEDERTVRRWIRVARYASPREEETYGAAKLDEVLRYLDALSGGELKGRLPVSFGDLRIPAERGGRRRRLRIEEATTEEIRAATRVKTKKPARSTASPQARAVQAALRARGLGDLDVRVVKGHLRLGAIPLARIADLAAALRAVRLPA